MAPRKTKGPGKTAATADYRHADEKRKNIPPAKIASEGKVPKVERVRYAYNPHLPPVLRFDPTGGADKLFDLVDEAGKRPLNDEERKLLRGALSVHEPWLEWAGKREQHERGWFEVDPVALHIHERVSAQACIRAAMREDVQRSLFADPQQPYREAVQFYRHDIDWANRLILGDSLQVMSSLAHRENLAGKVQMIYMDPPYGIKFASNFQPEISKKDVKERDQDLIRESEMVRAFRDTWRLGFHSYLGYLRDRLALARELLSPTGSFFLQIGDQNLHRVRVLLDEIFGAENFQAVITFRTSVPLKSVGLPGITDFVLWYCRDHGQMKRYDLFTNRDVGEGGIYVSVEERSGHRRPMMASEKQDPSSAPLGSRVFGTDNLVSTGFTPTCIYDVDFEGINYSPTSGKSWKTNRDGMARLLAAHRVNASGRTLRAMMYIEDYPVFKLSNLWTDVKGETEKQFVVQTSTKVIQRCVLMTTDPGDLVLDPTCGSGTTAAVAEHWGRRWITIDTSRVAIAIARQRLVTAKCEHYRTQGGPLPGNPQAENPATKFQYKTVPHITLKSIAQNTNLDPIFAKHAPFLDAALAACNVALGKVRPELRQKFATKLAQKQRAEGKRAVTDADRRRWDVPGKKFEHWTVPFDTDADWLPDLTKAVEVYRKAWRAKMDEVNACIEANAEPLDLVDQPEVVKGVVRVSGPFTVEGVRPEELSLGDEGLFDATPNEFDEDGGPDPRLGNLNAYLTKMVQSLRNDGLTFLNNQRRRFARIEALFENATGSVLHAEGVWQENGKAPEQRRGEPATVAITFGPQYGPVTAQQVEDAIRASRRYDELVVAGFSLDADASAVIEEQSHPKLRIHSAYIRPDLNPAMDGLLKETPGSQLFTVFGQPEVEVRKEGGDDEWVVELRGVDIYDPVANTVRSTGADKVAAWFLDQEYDGRCFCITQAFFPNQDAWGKIAKALGSSADLDAFEAFKGTVSLPFKPGKYARVAVKVIDPRGNEVMAIRALDDGD